MRSLFLLALIAPALSFAAAGGETELVKKFWTSVEQQDGDAIRPLVTDPEHAKYFAGRGAFNLKTFGDSYEVMDLKDDNTVEVRFSRDCFTDRLLPTVLADTGEGLKVDVPKTFKAIKASPAPTNTRKYCYEFKDQPLTGTINGKPWSFEDARDTEMTFGDRKKRRVSLYKETCPDSGCNNVNSASILVGGLDLTGDGGNFDGHQNITIYTPPGDNMMIREGSYRVTKFSDGKTKLELSFKKDDANQLNGYVVF